MDPYEIDVAMCRGRQQRLLAEMQREQLDLVIVNSIEHVQYLAGPRFKWFFSPVAALAADGRLTLIAPSRAMPEVHAADDVRPYDAQWLSTLRNDQLVAASTILLDALGPNPKPKRLGVEFSCCGPCLTQPFDAKLVDIDPPLYRLRRRKDPDELARLRLAIDATGAMYRRAREIIAPGLNELDMFNELQAAAVREFGEMLTGTGNDYACGERGGAPRDRPIEAGELYILDLGPAFRGYFADTCRAISVDGNPTDEQLRIWNRIVPVLQHVQATVKPGKSCRELFEEAKAMLDEPDLQMKFHSAAGELFKFEKAYERLELSHHLGHGIGLFPHETPHLNPNWDDMFEVGDVFTAEPGLYAPHLHMGIRLENNYLVTPTGVELLSDFPLEL